jgi:HPt (histidine-containing phosphotransfer) domain-containing protein
MTSSRLLLVEEDPAQAESLSAALQTNNSRVLRAADIAEAREALAIEQFDLILISSRSRTPFVAGELSPIAKRLSPPVPVVVYGECDQHLCDAVISTSLSPAALSRELDRICKLPPADQDRAASQLPEFDREAFHEQMAGDSDLMKEIISIFFEESASQLKSLEDALRSQEFPKASRLAHSLKGSLGSLHAAQARYWAQALETAAASRDGSRCGQYLSALEESISALQPRLKEVLPE